MGVHVAKFRSVGDWEVLYVDGEAVKQTHIGRVVVLPYLEGLTIDAAEDTRVNLPEDDYRYPDDLEDVIEDDDYDYDGEAYTSTGDDGRITDSFQG